MRVLFLGDIVAKSGRDAVLAQLDTLKEQYQPDFVIVNAENSAHGKGITFKIYNQLLLSMNSIVRPANMEPFHIGKSYVIKEVSGKRIAVVNLVGKVFMDVCREDPVITMEKLLKEIDADIIFVDLHAEATAEKMTFANYFAPRVTAVIGTHTHVQTADEQIINGCAYITDAGMCGVYASILGRDIEEVIARSIYNESTRYTPAQGPAVISGVLIEIDDKTNRANCIERIQIRPKG